MNWKGQIQSLVNGVKVYSINKGHLKKTYLLIPPLAEQEQIVSYLEDKTSKIDAYVADKEKEIELLQELKQKTIADAVTKGLNPDAKMKDSGISWIGEIPEHWETYRFAIICKSKSICNCEEEELLSQKKLLSSGEKIREGLSECCAILKGEEEGSAAMQLSAAESVLENVVKLEPELKESLAQLRQAILAIEGTGDVLEAYLDRAEQPQASLSEIEARLDQLFRFKVKYGSTIPDMLLFLENARTEADELNGSEMRLEQLHRDRLVLEKILMEKADAVHNARKIAAMELSRSIIAELSDLGMEGAVFSVAFSQRPRDRFFTRSGYDDVAFMMSANPGEPEKPLSKIASGGEASRIMLAIKTILAAADSTPTLIFDEIDAGISGRTATIVAQKLRRLSESHQVFCVTHMAQISAAADRHYIIEKETKDERTHTMIRSLEKKEREEEVARLLSGDRNDKTSLELAARLIAGRSGEFLASDLKENE